jgi:protein ImuB
VVPLVTAHRDGNRILLAAVSPEAQALGLHAGMPLTQARVLVSGLDVRDADHEGDSAWLYRLGLFAARRWTPRSAVSDPAGLWLDLSGVTHLFGGERRMCERILAFCSRLGLTAWIAVAGTTGAAHALARFAKEPLVICPPGAEAEALAPFPLSALRLEEQALSAARRLGVEKVGEIIAMPRAPLQRRLGKGLLLRLDQALGRVPEPIDPIVPEEPPSVRLGFLEPISTAEAIEEVAREAISRLVPLLEQAGLGVRRLDLLCNRVDSEVQRIAIGTVRPTRDSSHLARLLCAKIDRLEPGFGIESVRLVASRVEPLGPQTLEVEDEAPDLSSLIDRLAGRLGARRLFRLSAVESDIPERSVRRAGPLAEPTSWPEWPRPVRLLIPPEPVEHVIALHPDGGPMRFNWRGRAYRVAASDGPERLYGEWWRHQGEAGAVRDYFQVEDSEGARFWLFRKGDPAMPGTGDMSWHMHGVFG